MVLSRGRPLFLTQVEWDLVLILTSHIKITEKWVALVTICIQSTYVLYKNRRRKGLNLQCRNLHSKRPSSTTFIFVRWSSPLALICFVLFCFPLLISFSLILQFFISVVFHDCHTCAFSFDFSFQFYALIFVFDYNFLPRSTFVSRVCRIMLEK